MKINHRESTIVNDANRAVCTALTRFISPEIDAILAVQSEILYAITEFFKTNGFRQITAPLTALETDPGIRGAGTAVTRMYEWDYKITTSMNLQKFAAVFAMKKIFSVSPVIRLESKQRIETQRHLAEFRIIEIEIANARLEDIMSLCEEMICFVIGKINERCNAQLLLLNRTINIPKRPFERIRYADACMRLKSMGLKFDDALELPWEAEVELSKMFSECFWLMHFPNGSRGFYDRVDPQNPDYLLDMDMLYPEGFGEACSGGEREYTHEGIQQQMLRTGCNPDEYYHFLALSENYLGPSAGCGFGLERLTRYICGVDAIWDAVPFPKIPGLRSP